MKKLTYSLPPFLETIVYDYLAPVSQGTPIDVLALIALMECSKMLCFKRVVIKREETSVFPNVYGMVFMASGMGKDRTLNLMRKACSGTTEIMQQELRDYIKIKDAALRLEVNEPAMNVLDGDGKLIMSDPEKKKYIKENQAREVALNIGSATREGLLAQRAQLQEMGYGICHFSNTEFASSIKSTNNSVKELTGDLMDAYEGGENTTKAIKGETKVYDIKNVPQTFFAHSSVASLTKDYQANETLQGFFDDGFARRSLVCYSFQRDEPVRLSKEEKRKSANTVPCIEKMFMDTWNFIERNQVFTIADDVYAYFEDYQDSLAHEVYLDELNGEMSDSLKGEKGGRHRKALRLAGIFAAYRLSTEINMDDYIFAQAWVEDAAKGFIKFYKRRPMSQEEILIKELRKNGEMKMSGLKNLEIFRVDGLRKASLIKHTIEAAQELLEETGEILHVEEKKGQGKPIMHSIRERHQTATTDTPLMAYFSYSQQKAEYPSRNFEYIEQPFSFLHQYTIKSDNKNPEYTAYTTHSFKEGHRNLPNTEHTGNLLIIDIDNDKLEKYNVPELKIDDAKERLKEFKALIFPTKSHQKPEKGSVDRFRIILLADSVIKPVTATYEALGTSMLEELGLQHHGDESVAHDASKLILPSPEGTEYHYTGGSKLFNWKQFDIKPKMDNEIKASGNSFSKSVSYDNTNVEEAKAIDNYEQVAARLGMNMRFNKMISDEYAYFCPFPGHDSKGGTSFRIRKKDGIWVWVCQNCAKGGDIISFIREARDCTFPEAKEFLLNL